VFFFLLVLWFECLIYHKIFVLLLSEHFLFNLSDFFILYSLPFNFLNLFFVLDLLFDLESLGQSKVVWFLIVVLDSVHSVCKFGLASLVVSHVIFLDEWRDLDSFGVFWRSGHRWRVEVISLHHNLLRSFSLMEWALLFFLFDQVDQLFVVLFLLCRLLKIMLYS
jgi:hypothetical protein